MVIVMVIIIPVVVVRKGRSAVTGHRAIIVLVKFVFSRGVLVFVPIIFVFPLLTF